MQKAELFSELKRAVNSQNDDLALSIIESLIKQTISKAEMEDLLDQKLSYLERKKPMVEKAYLDQIVAKIFEVNPKNLRNKLRHIHNLFDSDQLQKALTEFKRFEAETLHHVQ